MTKIKNGEQRVCEEICRKLKSTDYKVNLKNGPRTQILERN